MKKRLPNPGGAAGFTIVEMLVSCAVLILMVAMIAELLNGATMATGEGRARMDEDTQARLIFDRMANDFNGMFRRSDVDYIFYATAATLQAQATAVNDAMYFYAEVPAYYDSSADVSSSSQNTTALVGYRINYNSTYYPSGYPVLERLSKGLTWDGAASVGGGSAPGGPIFLTGSGAGTPFQQTWLDQNWATTIGSYTAQPPYSNGSDPDYHVLSDRVLRFELAFLLNDGTISTMPVINPQITPSGVQVSGTAAPGHGPFTPNPSMPTSSNHAPSYGNGSRWFDTVNSRGFICTSSSLGSVNGTTVAQWNNIGIQDVAAVIVAIAVLDENSHKLIHLQGNVGTSESNPYVKLADSLADPVQPATGAMNASDLMSPAWSSVINSGTFTANAGENFGMPPTAAKNVRVYQRYFYLNNNP